MNKILAALGLLFVLLTGCCGTTRNSKLYEQVKGTHILRQVGQRMVSSQTTRASFFLVMGSSSSETTAKYEVSFSWLGNDGDYRFTTLPLDEFHVHLDERAATPFISFSLREDYKSNLADGVDLDGAYASSARDGINYVTITCRPEDWPVDIQIPTAASPREK